MSEIRKVSNNDIASNQEKDFQSITEAVDIFVVYLVSLKLFVKKSELYRSI